MFSKHLPCALLVLVLFPAAPAFATPLLPSINTNNVFNITNPPYNAVADGTTDNASGIQTAINAAAAASGGGTVELPGPGTYLSGPLTMKSKVNLQVDAGATLKFLAESSYPNATGTPAYCYAGTNLTDLEISGAGTIDGNGPTWWSAAPPSPPYLIYFSKCKRVLIQNVQLQNPPKMHVVFKNSASDITIQDIAINTYDPIDHNTDGIDLIGTNCLIQNCAISAGDDNIAIGSSSSSAFSGNIVISNCIFGYGHGLSLGGNTLGGVSNLTVVDCIWTNTGFGIRMKSDNAGSSPGAGGIAQNLNYYNLSMTNVGMPLLIFSYYNEYYPPYSDISTSLASSQPLGPGTLPVWKNIVISNLFATGSGESLIWGRTEMPVSNISLIQFQTHSARSSSDYNFGIYNAYGVQLVDSPIETAPGKNTFTLFNAGVVISNSSPAIGAISIDGLTSANSLALYNAPATMASTNLFGATPVTLGGCALTNSGTLTLGSSSIWNFLLGTNSGKVVINGGTLAFGGTVNVSDGGGLGAGNYSLFNWDSGGLVSGTPALGTAPPGYKYFLNTTNAGQIILVVAPTNTVAYSPVFGATRLQSGGSQIVFSGNGGPLSGNFYLLASTNIALPLTNWVRLATNAFDGGGNFTSTNPIDPNLPMEFYRLLLP
jgi:hypothetical protein